MLHPGPLFLIQKRAHRLLEAPRVPRGLSACKLCPAPSFSEWAGPPHVCCVWPNAFGLHLGGGGQKVCDWSVFRDEKIHLYLRMPTVADVSWCVVGLPSPIILVSTIRILPYTSGWFKCLTGLPQPLKCWCYKEPQLPPDSSSALTVLQSSSSGFCADLGYGSEITVLLLGKVHLTACLDLRCKWQALAPVT